MKMTLKEFKDLVGKDKEMNEGFIDSLRKKFGKQEQPKEEFIENYTRFYEDLKDFEKIVEFDRKEKYYLDMIGEQLLSIKEFQNRRDLKPENKNLGVKNGLESIEKIYLPELLQMLANHHPKQFKQKFHSDVLKFYKITVPEVTTKTTRISPRYFPNAIEQMITFAKQKEYSNQYIQKLEQLKNLAEHLKHGYLENPKALAGKEAEVSNFVETIKKILASWRRKYGADYNKMISPELKEFGLNEQSFRKKHYNMSEEFSFSDRTKLFDNIAKLCDNWERKVDSLYQEIKELESNKDLDYKIKEKKLTDLKNSYKEAKTEWARCISNLKW